MFSIILVSHAAVSAAMADSARMIAGEQEGLYSLEIMPGDSTDVLSSRLEQLLASAIQKGEAVVLSDFPLGTPFNLTCSLMQKYSFYHLTGMNMPLLIELLNNRRSSEPVGEICRRCTEAAKEQMFNINEYIKGLMD